MSVVSYLFFLFFIFFNPKCSAVIYVIRKVKVTLNIILLFLSLYNWNHCLIWLMVVDYVGLSPKIRVVLVQLPIQPCPEYHWRFFFFIIMFVAESPVDQLVKRKVELTNSTRTARVSHHPPSILVYPKLDLIIPGIWMCAWIAYEGISFKFNESYPCTYAEVC